MINNQGLFSGCLFFTQAGACALHRCTPGFWPRLGRAVLLRLLLKRLLSHRRSALLASRLFCLKPHLRHPQSLLRPSCCSVRFSLLTPEEAAAAVGDAGSVLPPAASHDSVQLRSRYWAIRDAAGGRRLNDHLTTRCVWYPRGPAQHSTAQRIFRPLGCLLGRLLLCCAVLCNGCCHLEPIEGCSLPRPR